MRWNSDDAIIHEPMRMHINSQTWTNLSQMISAFNNYRIAGRNFMKFNIDFMPLE
jgi:hypothetical protein